ncbi:hypothetical protein SRHO_G00047970 [Serrasalmus rhombeus]
MYVLTKESQRVSVKSGVRHNLRRPKRDLLEKVSGRYVGLLVPSHQQMDYQGFSKSETHTGGEGRMLGPRQRGRGGEECLEACQSASEPQLHFLSLCPSYFFPSARPNFENIHLNRTPSIGAASSAIKL